MRYLHEDLLHGMSARDLLSDTEDDIRARGSARVVTHYAPDGGGVATVAICARRWLVDGRRIVLLSPLTCAKLDESPPCENIDTPNPPKTIEIWYETPELVVNPDGSRAWIHGAIVSPGLFGPMASIAASLTGTRGDGWGVLECENLSVDGEQTIEKRLCKALRAIADERTAWMNPRPKRNRTRARKEKRAGLNVSRLVLSDDALSVWRRRHLAEREGSEREVTDRAPCQPHEVRPHECRVWVREPRLCEEILDDRIAKEASGGKPAVWLYCVSRPRRGHVRGHGDVTPSISRVVPAL